MPANAFSNYPNGFSHGVTLHGLPVLNAHHGNVWWVNSATGNDSGAADGSRNKPFATLDYAIGKTTANNGDVIMIAPNHAETITGAGGITADVAGISIIGLGAYNQRPRFLMDGGTTVDFAVSAADVTVQNCVFAAGHADIVRCFNVTAAGFNSLYNEFVNNTTDENWLTPIKATSTTDNNADGLTVIGNRFVTPDIGTLEFVEINATADGTVFLNNLVVSAGTASPLILVADGKLLTNTEIGGNKLQNLMTANELFFSNDGTTNTGIAYDNYCAHRDVTTTHDLGLESSGIAIFNLYSTSTTALQGGVIPAADANS